MPRIFLCCVFILSLSTSLKAQIQWEQFEKVHQLEVNDQLFDPNTQTLYTATIGGVYISTDAGITWEQSNDGFEKTEDKPNAYNNIADLVLVNQNIFARAFNGALYLREGNSWKAIHTNLVVLDIESFNNELYLVAEDTEDFFGFFYDYDVLKLSEQGELSFITNYGTYFFVFSEPIANVGDGILIARNSNLNFYDGETLTYFPNELGFAPRSVVGTSKNDIWALAFSFFGPNRFFKQETLYHFDGISWSAVNPKSSVGPFYGISQFYADNDYYVFGVDQELLVPKLVRQVNLPVVGKDWVDVGGFEEGVPPFVRGITKASEIDYLYWGRSFIRHSNTSLGFANSFREENIFTGEYDDFEILGDKLYFLNTDNQVLAFNKNTGDTVGSIPEIDNNSMYSLVKEEDQIVALKSLYNDSVAIYYKSAEDDVWKSKGLGDLREDIEKVGKRKGGLFFQSHYDFDNMKFYYYEFSFANHGFLERTIPDEENRRLNDFVSNERFEILQSVYTEREEGSLSTYYRDGKFYYALRGAEYQTIEYDKDNLYFLNFCVKEDSVFAVYSAINSQPKTTVIQYLNTEKVSFEPYKVVNGFCEQLIYKQGYWQADLNGEYQMSDNLTDWTVIGNEGIAKGANINVFNIDGNDFWCSTDGNACYKYNATSTSITESEAQQMQLYPNPNNGTFTINLGGKSIQELRVFDLTGSLHLSETFSKAKREHKLENLNLAPGVYILYAVDTENHATASKFTIK